MLSTRQLFLQHVAQTSEAPLALEIEKAEGIYLFDASGKRYADLISGIAVSNVGHRHPVVVGAIKEQLDKYMHLMVYGEYIQSPQVKLAKALSDILPEGLDSVYFVNSGTEAIEGAMKLAKRFTGRAEIIYCKNAYHGSSQGSLSIMGDEEFKNAFRPLLPFTRQIIFNDKNDLRHISEQTACVIMETIQGEAGAIVPEKSYLQAVRERCKQTGTLLVLDEVQCAFGRTGKMFAFEDFGIVPDILCIAKGMGGGMPIGAFVASRKIMASLAHSPVLGHITTFGGHPVCASAALATLKVLKEENLVEKVAAKEKLFRSLLVHPEIRAVRGKGLLLAIEFESAEMNRSVIDACIAKGLITDWFLFNPKSMRIAPPLIITEEQIRDACEAILSVLNA